MKLVLDTNAVLDWLHFRDPGIALVAQAVESRKAELVSAAECVEELRRVLAYPQFRLDAGQCEGILDRYLAMARLVDMPASGTLTGIPRCRDPDDQKFLELAWHAGADCLVTKDKALLRLSRAIARSGRFAILVPGEVQLS